MKNPALSALLDEMEAYIQVELDRRMGTILAQNEIFVANFAEVGKALRAQKTEIAALRAQLAAAQERIEQVAKEPRVQIQPAITVESPAVHFAPTVQVPARKPTKKTMTKMPDGSFKLEELE